MRLTLLASAVVMLFVGVIFYGVARSDPTYLPTGLMGFILGGLNLLLAIFTRPGGGVEVPPNRSDPVKLLVDKAALGTTIYMMAFSESRLVLKRLSSGKLTVGAAAALALLGLALSGLIGALMGGMTAFSLQEFATQKKRELVRKGDLLNAGGRGDLEIPFAHLQKVELTRNRVRLYLKDRLVRIVISRRYPDKMRPVLEHLIGTFTVEKG
jgi:hypothetical protein